MNDQFQNEGLCGVHECKLNSNNDSYGISISLFLMSNAYNNNSTHYTLFS